MYVYASSNVLSSSAEVEIVVKPNSLENIMVKADRKYMQQVFANLLGNALKYSKDNGFIHIDLSRIGNQVMVEVIDDGIGIAEEHLDRIFDRFYRIDPSRNRKAGGSGIGLSLVKHILEAHGQLIQVRSELGKGSNFNFLLDIVE